MVVSHEESRRPRDASSSKVDQLFDVRTSSVNTVANTIRLRESSRLILSMITSATWSAEGPCHGAHSRAAVTIARVARAAVVHPGPLRPMRKRRGGRGVAFDDMLHDLLPRSRGSLQFGAWLINKGVPNAHYLPDPCASSARVLVFKATMAAVALSSSPRATGC